eukprot:554929-Ditylum_brightwellii.AAC.1
MCLSFVSHPLCWGQDENKLGPPKAACWDSETFITKINATTQAPHMSGDVSQQNHKKKQVVRTTPPLEEYKPLKVSDDTCWEAIERLYQYSPLSAPPICPHKQY